jgi:pimeloyl-ACP methyl ester carboxylesterase
MANSVWCSLVLAVVLAFATPTSSFLAPPPITPSAHVCSGPRPRACMVAASVSTYSHPRRARWGLRRAGALGLSCTGTEPEALEVAGADGHPIRVWRKGPVGGKPIVLLHGRTWSARPVWDLQIGGRDGASELGTSTMDLLAAKGYRSWAPDFRGMGGTARDAQGWTTPDTTVADMKAVLDMLKAEGIEKPPLIGWSQGALIAQMVAQEFPGSISHVALYASIYDPDQIYPPPTAGAPGLLGEQPPHVDNTMEGAMEDWTVPGIIDDEAAQAFGDVAMVWDARKVSWNALEEFNTCDPSKVTIPTLVIHGEKDIYTSMDKQAALFTGIANGNKAWRVVPGCDHPVHLYPKQRQQWLDTCLSFFESPL